MGLNDAGAISQSCQPGLLNPRIKTSAYGSSIVEVHTPQLMKSSEGYPEPCGDGYI